MLCFVSIVGVSSEFVFTFSCSVRLCGRTALVCFYRYCEFGVAVVHCLGDTFSLCFSFFFSKDVIKGFKQGDFSDKTNLVASYAGTHGYYARSHNNHQKKKDKHTYTTKAIKNKKQRKSETNKATGTNKDKNPAKRKQGSKTQMQEKKRRVKQHQKVSLLVLFLFFLNRFTLVPA